MNEEYSSFAASLLSWFAAAGRDLPWRHTRDPYQIWLSEIILQQTRVEQGLDYWRRFVRRWPTVQELAAATQDEVLREWQGLGYYSRARNLHEAARQVVAKGGFPQTVEGLKALRGVGPYTAAAIASFAFDVPAAVVDGNVYRVLARYWGIDVPIDSTEGHHLFASLAQELMPAGRAADYNQAIMDFGATMCTPANAACLVCPLTESCVARSEGRVGQLPVKAGKTRVQERRFAYIYIRYKGTAAFRRRGPGDFWQGLWEPVLLPCGECADARSCQSSGDVLFGPEEYLSRWEKLAGRKVALGEELVVLARGVKHLLSHRKLICDFCFVEVKQKPELESGYRWVKEDMLDNLAKPRLVEIMLERVARHLSGEALPT